nr:copper-binding protein [uncultured Duganella sp.]
MKFTATCSVILTLLASTAAFAQADTMKGMNGAKMKDMDMQKCMDMKGMDMKDMTPDKCKTMMSGSDKRHLAKNAQIETHKVTGVVKEVDAAKGKVMLDHQAVKSLNWPAMTMGFTVKNEELLTKLSVGKKVNVELRKEGTEYVVVAVK